VNEHDGEVIRGLPGVPPRGERILWQGSPDWRSLAMRAFKVRAVLVYFGLLVVWQAAVAVHDGGGIGEAAQAVLWILPLGLLATGVLTLLAWLNARSTVFTVTDRRIVVRAGVALPMAVNLPFAKVTSAALRHHSDGTGDIPIVMGGKERVSTIMMWPYVRPWKMGRPEPMLRAVREPDRVARILADALAAHAATAAATAPATVPAATPARPQAQPAARPMSEPALRDAHA
jgi:hypothetical protein